MLFLFNTATFVIFWFFSRDPFFATLLGADQRSSLLLGFCFRLEVLDITKIPAFDVDGISRDKAPTSSISVFDSSVRSLFASAFS
jgi:hypothetical protein